MRLSGAFHRNTGRGLAQPVPVPTGRVTYRWGKLAAHSEMGL
jgi:hypothetical protein